MSSTNEPKETEETSNPSTNDGDPLPDACRECTTVGTTPNKSDAGHGLYCWLSHVKFAIQEVVPS